MTAPATATTAVLQRKRGAALEEAILTAAYDELTDVGYASFSVEGVAARARTGKASIYRRWPTKQLLVLDSLCGALPTAEQCGIEMEFADDVTTVEALHQIAQIIASVMDSPAGKAMRAIKCEAFTDPELARTVDERFQAPRRAALLGLLRRGVGRGEVRPEAVTELVADVLPAIIGHRVILMRVAVTEKDIKAIIDEILVPLVEVR
jgi:AcrR family transcriptional regulator